MRETPKIDEIEQTDASTDDYATQLLKRIKRISQATGMDFTWAAWAIMYQEAIGWPDQPRPTPPSA